MATIAIVGCVGVITCMATAAIIRYRKMRTFQHIIIVMNRETGRFPTRISGMASDTFGGNAYG